MGKTFSIGENGMNPLGVLPIPQNVWKKDPEDRHTGIPGLWTQVGRWTLDAERYTLDAGLCTLDTVVDCFRIESE